MPSFNPPVLTLDTFHSPKPLSSGRSLAYVAADAGVQATQLPKEAVLVLNAWPQVAEVRARAVVTHFWTREAQMGR